MEIITEWRLYVVNGGYFISHFQLIVCDLEEIWYLDEILFLGFNHKAHLCVFVYLFLYSAQYLHILQDSERYLTHPTAQVQSQLTSNSHSPN